VARYAVLMPLTRRDLAAVLLAPAAAAAAQTQPAAVDEVQAARDRIKANAAALAKVELPMAVEPAFQFKA
jgi:hypothetical protein